MEDMRHVPTCFRRSTDSQTLAEFPAFINYSRRSKLLSPALTSSSVVPYNWRISPQSRFPTLQQSFDGPIPDEKALLC